MWRDGGDVVIDGVDWEGEVCDGLGGLVLGLGFGYGGDFPSLDAFIRWIECE
jgi:hypothetical protein